jgi:hypothetical protein
LTATIDGQSWVGTISTAVNSAGVFAIAATNAAGLTLAFGAPAVQGTTSVGLTSGTNAQLAQDTQGWQAAVTNGSGTVNITSINATSATGTFSFTLVPVVGTGASGNRTVSNGSFSVTF